MKNTDRVVDYVLEHEGDLTPEKIQALAEVIKALGGEVEMEPNKVQPYQDPNLVDEEAPLDLTKIDKIEVDGNEHPVKIY